MNLKYDAKFYVMMNDVAAGTSVHNSAVAIDCKDCDAVCFVGKLAAVSSSACAQLVPLESSSTSSFVALSSGLAGSTAATTGYSEKLLVSDIIRPKDRYLSVRFNRATANAAMDTVIGIAYQNKYVPVTQSTDHVADSEISLSPST